jgi:hypothetical protein
MVYLSPRRVWLKRRVTDAHGTTKDGAGARPALGPAADELAVFGR